MGVPFRRPVNLMPHTTTTMMMVVVVVMSVDVDSILHQSLVLDGPIDDGEEGNCQNFQQQEEAITVPREGKKFYCSCISLF
jgi:hypothetical protein